MSHNLGVPRDPGPRTGENIEEQLQRAALNACTIIQELHLNLQTIHIQRTVNQITTQDLNVIRKVKMMQIHEKLDTEICINPANENLKSLCDRYIEAYTRHLEQLFNEENGTIK